MSIYRPEIGYTHVFKKHSRNNKLFKTALIFLHTVYYSHTTGDLVEGILKTYLEIPVSVSRPYILKIT